MSLRLRMLLLIGLGLIGLIACFSIDPVAQDLAYHQFADVRALSGIPNWQNVLSNLPFLYVGALGIMAVWHNVRFRPYEKQRCDAAWFFLFLGVFLTGFGSAYYHWNPNNDTLVWDRLPMSVGFAAFFCGLIGERVSLKAYRFMLYPVILLGIGSVLYWNYTESIGAGDLRPYLYVQLMPIFLIPFLMYLFPSPYTGDRYLLSAMLLYVAAKLLEYYDQAIFGISWEITSGHALKHLVAALACGSLYYLYAYRKPSDSLKA